ncbi:hypothetical protein [Sphingobacterium thalpophilum]|uniref:Uncharacterized protein n=1 Tax=Sphingobacterium thalpophilum TaxID=259 RepID=A0A4U9VCG1_9SPHI|nr:hypothetical protein [Sphingobacterium thalpophilum]VTR42752.1 Uncharacterised protein [Sphingobacterium thalpophilum]
MKNVFPLTVMLLLVSSCGLFKKTVKTTELHKAALVEHNGLRSDTQLNEQHVRAERSDSTYSIEVSGLMLLEGEGIQLRPDGSLHIEKGRLHNTFMQHETQKSENVKVRSGKSEQKLQHIQYGENTISVLGRQDKKITEPAVTRMLYFLVGLLAVVYGIVWWLRRKYN